MSSFLQLDDGRQLALDEHGHLQNRKDWSEAVAVHLAALDKLELTDIHWLVIGILRDYYDEYGIEPPMRALVSLMKANDAKAHANSLELYRLFPEGPARQGSRYAGLPIPLSCI
jgi:tRNA 2-thiouridine synthesizing protein E